MKYLIVYEKSALAGVHTLPTCLASVRRAKHWTK